MAADPVIPFGSFKCSVFFNPVRGEFSGRVHIVDTEHYLPGHTALLSPNSDANILYEEVAEEFAMWMQGLLEAMRTKLPIA